jgi:hypothetical protein
LVSLQQFRKVATFLRSVFSAKKFRRAVNTIHRQLLLKIKLDLDDTDLTKKKKEIGQEMAFWEVE